MDSRIDARNQCRCRADRDTAKRVDLAAVAAGAFDVRAARNDLRLSGIDSDLISSFTARHPRRLRVLEPGRSEDRCRPHDARRGGS